MVVSWSGVSAYGKASSSSRCQGVSGAEGVAGRGHPRGVQPDQVGRDLLDRLLRARLGLRPVRAAQPVQRRRLAADVLGDLLQLVGGDEEPVAGLAALGRGVLHHQVLAGGALDGALHHLDVAADAVLLVHDVVAADQGQRVDGLAAPRGHPPHVLGGRALPRQVGLGEHRQFQHRVDEAVLQGGGRHMDDRRGQVGRRARRAVGGGRGEPGRRCPRRPAPRPAGRPDRGPR